ncbi:LysR family transcriptional regulator [Vibrio marisflavi]|uniref:HTH-type transcriptional regulator TrpI n=1 Tax=Vibrio marisflavi CECT 7928 TaxID=634439 RepID=A0ABN8DY72_9VIBR|nr:LysR family transcriptional regulator [Vibrio marisflavi]CAH0536263.1 HTH-type transcriptional regulator TrpI [Vibrio marisflavi CECT 7928]
MTPYPNIPYSHHALKTFEAVARLLSFTLAADELNVTQSAVSRQIKQLEEELNTALIVRKHRAIELTQRGEELSFVLGKNFQSIESLISSWQLQNKQRLVIKASLSFTTRTLITKLHELHEKYPDYEIIIIPSLDGEACVTANDYDLLIFCTKQPQVFRNQPNMIFLREEYMAPVCATSSTEERVDLQSILAMPRVHSTLDHYDWKLWLANQNVESSHNVRDISFYSLDVALSACLAGQGATVTDLLLVLPELQRGFLKCPDQVKIQYSAWQYFCFKRNNSPLIDEIIQWVQEQAKSEITQLQQLAKKHHWTGVVD